VWARSGREMFYLDADGLLTSVPVQVTGSIIKPGNATRLLSTRYIGGSTSLGRDVRGYDVSPDGQRFLMIKDNAPSDRSSNATSAGIVIVEHWFEELKARVPTR